MRIMKKLIILLSSVLPLYLTGYQSNSAMNCLSGLDVEARVAYFHPNSHTFRRIYHGGVDLQVEFSTRVWNDFHAWFNIEWFSKKGHSIGLHDDTHVRILPLSLGIKYFYCLCSSIKAYTGIGATYTWLRTKDDNPFVIRHVSKKSYGLALKSGLIYDFCNGVYVDLFADYMYLPFHFSGSRHCIERHDAQVGGVKVGCGLGYHF